ncbi:MAG: PQQ-binding-like beta-propeller repeat protein [Candidatus Aminicenantes bacterium]|nr:PQQ-binding-like beta-propeller repeat protein [Candidatus Aminicenantes bacterium]
MLSYIVRISMKKSCLCILIILIWISCSLSKPKVIPYPSGIMFPLKTDSKLIYAGTIINSLKKEENRIFLSTKQGSLYCIDGMEKEILWEFKAPEALASAPYLDADLVFVISENHTLYSLNHRGHLLWQKHIPEPITSPIGGTQGQIIVGTEKGTVFCLSAESGEIKWSFRTPKSIRSNPVVWNDQVIFGCDDHHIYSIDSRGTLIWKKDAGEKVGPNLFLSQDFLYFGTADHQVQCLELKRKKLKWSVDSGGLSFVPPVVKGKKIFFLCGNAVLFCLNRKNGTVLWWKQVPSRPYFRMEIIEHKILVSSLSAKLVCFDIDSGKQEGVFHASREIRSNPLWFPPYLLVALYDGNSQTGELVFIKKEVKVNLSASKKPPQTVSEDITFKAKAIGFHLPEYEFSLSRMTLNSPLRYHVYWDTKGEATVVQPASEENTWSWIPSEPGIYLIEVQAEDEKEKASSLFPYIINREKPKLLVDASLPSPQETGTEIVFKASVSVLKDPEFEFRLIRLKHISYRAGHPWLTFEEEKIVQESSEESFWSWSPDRKGIYFLRIIASGPRDSVEKVNYFIIKKPKQ